MTVCVKSLILPPLRVHKYPMKYGCFSNENTVSPSYRKLLSAAIIADLPISNCEKVGSATNPQVLNDPGLADAESIYCQLPPQEKIKAGASRDAKATLLSSSSTLATSCKWKMEGSGDAMTKIEASGAQKTASELRDTGDFVLRQHNLAC